MKRIHTIYKECLYIIKKNISLLSIYLSIIYISLLLILFLFLTYKPHFSDRPLACQLPWMAASQEWTCGATLFEGFSAFLIHAVKLPSEGPPRPRISMLKDWCPFHVSALATSKPWHSPSSVLRVFCAIHLWCPPRAFPVHWLSDNPPLFLLPPQNVFQLKSKPGSCRSWGKSLKSTGFPLRGRGRGSYHIISKVASV